MTWVAQENGVNLYEKTHWTDDGVERIGSAYWWFKLTRADHMEDKCMMWPPANSPARARMAEFAIANAALLGAEFVIANPGTPAEFWYIDNKRIMHGEHKDQAEAACAFLSHKGFWVCFNKNADQWELARI